jgi:hypothetical protein
VHILAKKIFKYPWQKQPAGFSNTMQRNNNDLVNDNLNYAIGLYDIYDNDSDLVKALQLKGLSEPVIREILFRIKQEAMTKRIAQARKHIVAGLGTFAILYVIKILLSMLPVTGSIDEGSRSGDGMLIAVFKFYREVFYFLMILTLLRAIFGIYNYRKYKKEMKSQG